MMSYIELINRLWSANKVERFTQAERDLYYYLLNECNQNFWKQPVSCPTAVIVSATGLSKQTVTRAREGLKERGLINFKKGAQNSRAPCYEIITDETACVTARGTAHVTADGTACDTAHETIIYKTEDTKTKRISSNAHEQKILKDMDELQNILVADVDWKRDILLLLSNEKKSIPDGQSLDEFLRQFFLYLRTSGTTHKDERDCRNHFINWLKKQIINSKPTNTKYDNSNRQQDTKRGNIKVNVCSATDYEAPF